MLSQIRHKHFVLRFNICSLRAKSYFVLQDRSGLRGLIPGSGNGRLMNPVVIEKQHLFPQDESLCRPQQPGISPAGEVNTPRYVRFNKHLHASKCTLVDLVVSFVKACRG